MGIKPLLPHTLYILRQRSKEQNSNLVLVDTNLNKTEVFEIKEVGYIPLVSYLLSLEAKLVLQDRRIRDEYAIIKNKVLSYKGVKSRISFKRKSFNVGRTKLICLTIREKKMSLLVSCPQVLCEDSKVKYKMLEDDQKYDYSIKISSPLQLKKTLVLIDLMMMKKGLSRIDSKVIVRVKPKKNLLNRVKLKFIVIRR